MGLARVEGMERGVVAWAVFCSPCGGAGALAEKVKVEVVCSDATRATVLAQADCDLRP